MERGDRTIVRKGGKRDTRVRGAPAAARRPRGNSPLREAVVTLDAEDIALARLQAHLRRAETIQSAPRSAASTARRTTVQLPDSLLLRLRERARREGVTPSEVVRQAVENFLRSR
jgi:predicted DNA binding CopG/RHH family protein